VLLHGEAQRLATHYCEAIATAKKSDNTGWCKRRNADAHKFDSPSIRTIRALQCSALPPDDKRNPLPCRLAGVAPSAGILMGICASVGAKSREKEVLQSTLDTFITFNSGPPDLHHLQVRTT
jgi:hypothetical protein